MQSRGHPSFDRPNLVDGLVEGLHELIATGQLPDGARINEVHLTSRLGVSRTPLREALMRLVAERVVEIRPRRGFFVAPLDEDEFVELYAMRALLDPEALALAGVPTAPMLAQLRALNDKLREQRGASKRIELDDQWHRLLVAGCPNRVLLHTIDRFIMLTRRYEQAYFREAGHVQVAVDEHDRILAALAAGDLKGACHALRQNMQSGLEPLRTWIRSRR